MSVSPAIDTSGIAVITGGASGFGLDIAKRLVRAGMEVAILDVSQHELQKAEQVLCSQAAEQQKIFAVPCNVTIFEECKSAQIKVAGEFPGRNISFLFNNAGIAGKGSKPIDGDMENWYNTMSVNAFGVVHIIKAFLPGMITGGALPSGKKSYVVTTSSVVGLLNHNIGAYSVSKFACTAICEQLAIELEEMGAQAKHISPHSLHPTVGATKFLTERNAKGESGNSGDFIPMVAKGGMTTASQVIDGLFKGLDEGKHYIVVDHELDIPTPQQLVLRMEDQMSGGRPRAAQQLAGMLMLTSPEDFKHRRQERAENLKSKL